MYFFILLEVHIWDWRASIFDWKSFGKIKVCPPKSKVDSHLLIALESVVQLIVEEKGIADIKVSKVKGLA